MTTPEPTPDELLAIIEIAKSTSPATVANLNLSAEDRAALRSESIARTQEKQPPMDAIGKEGLYGYLGELRLQAGTAARRSGAAAATRPRHAPRRWF